jgi:type II secretory pathway component PulF
MIARKPTLKIPLSLLSVFCGNVATCLSAGLGVPASLRTSVRYASNRVLKEIAETAAEQTAAGEALAEAIRPSERRFPAFFLPVVRCGEQSGRLDEAFAYLAEHCALLVRPGRLVRNTWLFPVLIVLLGSIIKIALYAIFAPRAAAIAYAGDTFLSYAVAAAAVGAVLILPQTKAIVDQITLAIPVLRETQCDLAANRFFHALNLVYSTGGMRVEAMIRLAAQSVGNGAIRADLLQAAEAIEAGATIAEAFRAPQVISLEYQEMIHAGEVAGRLEQALSTICRLTAQTLEQRLKTFNRIFQRVLDYAVISSIAVTAFALAMSYRP